MADLLQPGQGGVEGHVFRQIGHGGPRGGRPGGGVADGDLAAGRRDQAQDDLHQRGFARAVVAQQRHPFAGRDDKADPGQGGDLAEPLSEL
jgi:hypothetical protein